MCEYCKNVDTGDDYYPILNSHIDFGFFGNVGANIYLKRGGSERPLLVLRLHEYNGRGVSEEHIQSIKYCPMCGRKLNNE